MFLPPLSPKCLFKESRWMTNTWSAMDCHSVCVWKKKKPFETDVNVSQMTTLLLLHFPLCVWSKVVILNFISCGLILEVQDNLRCRNSSFSHFIMFWLKTFYIHFSQFVWCSCTQFKINACLKRYRLLSCGSCYTHSSKCTSATK